MLPSAQGRQAAAHGAVERRRRLVVPQIRSIRTGKRLPLRAVSIVPLPQPPCTLVLHLCHVCEEMPAGSVLGRYILRTPLAIHTSSAINLAALPAMLAVWLFSGNAHLGGHLASAPGSMNGSDGGSPAAAARRWCPPATPCCACRQPGCSGCLPVSVPGSSCLQQLNMPQSETIAFLKTCDRISRLNHGFIAEGSPVRCTFVLEKGRLHLGLVAAGNGIDAVGLLDGLVDVKQQPVHRRQGALLHIIGTD